MYRLYLSFPPISCRKVGFSVSYSVANLYKFCTSEGDPMFQGPAYNHYYLGDFKNGKIENMVRVLPEADIEAALAATLLPTVFTETVPLKDDFG
ncbi:hypothetical protein GCK32_021403 [Trichostrongylus colubriformis]|uniref:Uncharacterized protein n=1 Tax=Trichostrongylus colubriformis TaxID=6319 RepID=A0AAN8FJU4_TRICO